MRRTTWGCVRVHAEPVPALAMQPAAVVALPALEPVVTEPAPTAALLPATPENDSPASNDDGEVEEDSINAGSATPEKAEPAASAKVEDSSAGEAAIAEAHELVAKGNKLKALNVLRRAAKVSPTDAKLLAELASAAEQDRAWGEAVHTARLLVEADPSAESKLSLARLERKTGHRARALELVRRVLNENPDSPEARAMLGQLGAAERLALQK